MKGRAMRRMLGWVFISVCLSLCARTAAAADLSKLSDADRQQVNEWMAQRATAMIEAYKLEREVSGAWSDKAYTSPEVEKLRDRYRELQQELLQTQQDIQKKVQEVPAVQAKLRQLDEAKAKGQELTKKIVEKTGE